MKFAHGPQVIEGMAHYGWNESILIKLGVLEITSILLYLLPPTSVLGTILLTGYLGGAIATHLRVDESAAAPAIIGVIAWLGLFLREERLWDLLPVRGKEIVYVREIIINRPLAEVFNYLRPLDNFRNWNPFLRKDLKVNLQSRGTDGQVGYVATWDGNREVGSGEQEITRILENERIEFELRFKKPFAATNRAYFSTEAVGASQTRVRWSMTGKTSFPMSVICVFFSLDKMIGGEFEWGLSKLKSILEK